MERPTWVPYRCLLSAMARTVASKIQKFNLNLIKRAFGDVYIARNTRV